MSRQKKSMDSRENYRIPKKKKWLPLLGKKLKNFPEAVARPDLYRRSQAMSIWCTNERTWTRRRGASFSPEAAGFACGKSRTHLLADELPLPLQLSTPLLPPSGGFQQTQPLLPQGRGRAAHTGALTHCAPATQGSEDLTERHQVFLDGQDTWCQGLKEKSDRMDKRSMTFFLKYHSLIWHS